MATMCSERLLPIKGIEIAMVPGGYLPPGMEALS
jgi:hypothetical protein